MYTKIWKRVESHFSPRVGAKIERISGSDNFARTEYVVLDVIVVEKSNRRPPRNGQGSGEKPEASLIEDHGVSHESKRQRAMFQVHDRSGCGLPLERDSSLNGIDYLNAGFCPRPEGDQESEQPIPGHSASASDATGVCSANQR
jgi:hypothetical protein